MARLKIKLARNLRRTVLRGHPWVYREALANPPDVAKAELCQVLDAKGELGWAIYDPHGPLSLRFISTERTPPTLSFWTTRMARALALRSGVRSSATNAYRLFNGEGDLLPGMICDIYGETAVLQFDGTGPSEFWDRAMVGDWLLKNVDGLRGVLEKGRRSSGDRSVEDLAGESSPREVEICENGARFLVNLEKGQKTGFFLDQRDNRHYVRQAARNQSLLNLFSYTGGFSINAGLGGAKRVASLDIARGAIDLATCNWALNGLAPALHEGLCVDVFTYLQQSGGEPWDHILVDPPSMGHTDAGKDVAIRKYIELFHAAAKRVVPGGQLSLSSCSSHVSFEDFFEVITEALSLARRKGQILRVSGQGADHPFPHACPELRYLKFVHLALN